MGRRLAACAAATALLITACGGVPAPPSDAPSVPPGSGVPASPIAGPPTPSLPAATASPTTTASPAPPNVYAATVSGELSPAVADIPPRVYVPHEISGTVSVIDPVTFEVIDGFATGSIAHHVAPSWDMTRLYVNNMFSDTLTEIDAATGEVIGSISVGRPYNLYFTPDGRYNIVVAEDLWRLDFFERETWEFVKSVHVPYWGVDHMDFAADGSYLLAGTEFDGWLVKVDLNTLEISGELYLGGLPVDVKVSPDGSVFFVANQGRHGVSIVDPVTMTEIGFIPTGEGAHGLQVSRDTRSLYVSNRLAGTMSVIDFETRTVTATWNVGGSPDMLNLSPDGTQLWFSNRYHDTVTVISTVDGSTIATIPVDRAPHGLTYFPQPGTVSIGHNGVYR